MRFRLQLITISDDGSERIHPVAELARGCELRPETTGLTLAEGKPDPETSATGGHR